MGRITKIGIGLAACGALALAGAALLPSLRSRGYKTYYFPELNLYYDPAGRQYAYTLDDARSWTSFAASDEPAATLGQRVELYSPTPQPWMQNAEHRKAFGGRMLRLSVPQPTPGQVRSFVGIVARDGYVPPAPVVQAPGQEQGKAARKSPRRWARSQWQKIRQQWDRLAGK